MIVPGGCWQDLLPVQLLREVLYVWQNSLKGDLLTGGLFIYMGFVL